jgi:hypothetical protein
MGNTYRHSEKQGSKGMDGCPLTVQDACYREFAFDEWEDQAEGDGVTTHSKVIGAIRIVYHTATVYCWAVVRDFLQLTNFHCSSRHSPCHGQFFVLLLCFWGDGEQFSLSDGNGDIEGTVNNFEDDSRVLDGGGVVVLWTQGVRGGSILTVAGVIVLLVEAVMMGALMVTRETGALGLVALDWFSLAAPAWSGCLRMLSGAFPFLVSISTPLNWTCFFIFWSSAC